MRAAELLVVVGMGGAGRAVVTVHRAARVTLVRVLVQRAFGELEGFLRHHLVERGRSAAEGFARVAVAGVCVC